MPSPSFRTIQRPSSKLSFAFSALFFLSLFFSFSTSEKPPSLPSLLTAFIAKGESSSRGHQPRSKRSSAASWGRAKTGLEAGVLLGLLWLEDDYDLA